MKFVVYRHVQDRDSFVVTDSAHERDAVQKLPVEDKLEKVGEFPEMGEERAAFDESLAKNSIKDHGFYRFAAKTFAPAGQPPLTMP